MNLKNKIRPEIISIEDCLNLKLKTKNRLKLISNEKNQKKTMKEIYKLLEIDFPKKKKIFKPFSDRITQPLHFSKDNNYQNNSTSPHNPHNNNNNPHSNNNNNNNNNNSNNKIKLQTALKFVQRQTEWLYKKNSQNEEINEQIHFDELPISSKVNTNESWKRAQRTNQKYLLQKTQQQIEREKIQKQVEIVKYTKLEIKLKELLKYDSSVLPTLQNVQKKLFYLQNNHEENEENENEENEENNNNNKSNQVINSTYFNEINDEFFDNDDNYGDDTKDQQQEKEEDDEKEEEDKIDLNINLTQNHIINQNNVSSSTENISESKNIIQSNPIFDTPQLSTISKNLSYFESNKFQKPPLQQQQQQQQKQKSILNSNIVVPTLDSDEIPIPELDLDGRVLFPGYTNDNDSDWDKLSEDLSEKRDDNQPQSKPLQPIVDVHVFLETMRQRSISNVYDPNSFDSEDDDDNDDDESASIY